MGGFFYSLVSCLEILVNLEGKLCPNCKRDIGIWAHLKSALPNLGLKCPNCRARLKYVPAGWGLFFGFLGIYAVLVVIAGYFVIPFFHSEVSIALSLVIWTGICIVLWLPFDIFAARRLRAKSKLELK